jgi:hypothetical protein
MRSAGLVLLFGSGSPALELAASVIEEHPDATIAGCSTAGEIFGTTVSDGTLVSTAIEFDSTEIRSARETISSPEQSLEVGERLARSLPVDGLAHVLIFSDGLTVNGSELVQGLAATLPHEVTVTGGLAGDGERFEKCWVMADGHPESGAVVAVGLYGRRLRVGYASLGGWDPFGPERLVTRSRGNVLYELDGRSALDLYKRYLGENAAGLPASGLLFPLAVRTGGDREPAVVRTILCVDEEEQSLVFAGDVPTGSYARLMKANFDRLIDGAVGAARTSREAVGGAAPDLALLISCVGRKMVLRQRIEEEIEGVREVLGETTPLCGFYSYGEISPFTPSARCELHNQTMTITTLSER